MWSIFVEVSTCTNFQLIYFLNPALYYRETKEWTSPRTGYLLPGESKVVLAKALTGVRQKRLRLEHFWWRVITSVLPDKMSNVEPLVIDMQLSRIKIQKRSIRHLITSRNEWIHPAPRRKCLAPILRQDSPAVTPFCPNLLSWVSNLDILSKIPTLSCCGKPSLVTL